MPEETNLETLYQKMYELTHGRCGCEGTGQYGCGCCATFHCLKAKAFALDKYGIDLQATGHPVMFMGETGCVVPPYLRPICTLHVCNVVWGLGEFPDDTERTKEYFALKSHIFEEARKQGKHPFINKGASMELGSQKGAVLSIVRADGTVDVWSIPTNATITIQTAKGFGGLSEVDSADSLASAESVINGQLVTFGAQ